MTDSQRSPSVAATAARTPRTRPTHQRPSSSPVTVAHPTTMQETTDPAKPSQDFFGEITGAIGCFPNSTPTAYPPMSEAAVTPMNVKTAAAPRSSASNSATNEPRNGM